MRKIRIFIGSSIDDLAFERRDLVSFIAELNNRYIDRGIYVEPYICEEKSNELRADGSQRVHDDYIANEADAVFFLFFRKAGQYTMRELEIARKTLLSRGDRPHIFIFFKTVKEKLAGTKEIKFALDRIAGEYAHYYKKFSQVDTVKLELLQYLSAELEETPLTIQSGKVFLGDVEVTELDVGNVLAFQSNPRWLALKKELRELELRIQQCAAEKNWSKLSELSDRHRSQALQLETLERDLLHLLRFLFQASREKNVPTYRLTALRLLEEGHYEEALLLLPLDEIRSQAQRFSEKRDLTESAARQEAREIIKDARARLLSLRFDAGAPSDPALNQALETYGSVLELAFVAGDLPLLVEYTELLADQGHREKALAVVKRIADSFGQFPPDLYAKYDVYTLLSELSEKEEEQELYDTLAKKSMLDHVRAIDRSDRRAFTDACERIAELFFEPHEILPLLREAVALLENGAPRDTNDEHRLFRLYRRLGEVHRELSQAKEAEQSYRQAARLAAKKTDSVDLADLFGKTLRDPQDRPTLPEELSLWSERLVSVYEALTEWADGYESEYIDSLASYAIVLFLTKRYGAFVDTIKKAAALSGSREEYSELRAFAAQVIRC